MGTVQKAKKPYVQKFRDAWMENAKYKKWLRRVESDPTKASCLYCKSEFSARLADIDKHASREKHLKVSEVFNPHRQRTITIRNTLDATKINRKKAVEASLALYAAVHGNMNVIDHLGSLCSSKFTECEAAQVQLHRTKCTSMMKNILSPHFRKELRDDIGVRKFSLILDESTDISVTKFLGIVIRYHSEKKGHIVTTFLHLEEITAGTAEAIVAAVEKTADAFDLNLRNLLGIGTDNASVMIGVNNGVFALLKKKYDLPHLVLIRCICHSLQLAVSHATTETLPRNLDYMIRETYNWFSYSSVRQAAYKEIYAVINEGATPLKIRQLSGTRWISIEPAIDRILQQWDELKTHFGIVKRSESCYTAELLYANYMDGENKVYLLFIHSIPVEVQRTNKAFQSMSADPAKLLDDLKNLIRSVTSKIFIPTARVNIFKENIDKFLDPNPYLGYSFERALGELDTSAEKKKNLKGRCIAFTIKLCHELQNRLPTNLVLLEQMVILHPSESLKNRVHKLPNTDLAREFIDDPKEIAKLENQWNNLTNIKWMSLTSSEGFWDEISKYRDSCNENPYNELSEFALNLLSLPYSNADVERVFSQMNLVKNKLRNRMSADTTNAILDIRYGLKRSGQCCHTYEFPKEVIAQIGTMQTYTGGIDNSRRLVTPNTLADDTEEDRVCDLMAELLSSAI